jgi:ubiquitin C-terminal hydrolase
MDRNAFICYKMIQTQRERNYSEIQDVFYAEYMSEILSLDKTVVSTTAETFLILNLDIPNIGKNVSLIDCFDEFTKSELLDGENSWYNDKIRKYEPVLKRISFWSLPKILIITFKRFSHCGSKKNDKFVDFPLKNLNLSRYVKGYNSEKYVYDLFGVANHYGGIENGHYTSISFDSAKWTYYNDEASYDIKSDEIVSNYAYCLFYRMK